MARLIAFNFITLNGFYKGEDEDISWHRHGEEESRYSEEMLAQGNILVFGRKTYEHMAGFWPEPFARDMFPKVADGMNNAKKIVVSRNSGFQASWNNSSLLTGNIIAHIEELKNSSPQNMAILGSGELISSLSDHKLIDEYQIMIDPVAIGNGTPVFKGIKSTLSLKLNSVKQFNSGVVLLTYNNI